MRPPPSILPLACAGSQLSPVAERILAQVPGCVQCCYNAGVSHVDESVNQSISYSHHGIREQVGRQVGERGEAAAGQAYCSRDPWGGWRAMRASLVVLRRQC